MSRISKLIMLSLAALAASAAVATAASPVLVGTYTGPLSDGEGFTGESIRIDVAKGDDGKFVDKVVVDESTTTDCLKYIIKKNAEIKKTDAGYKFTVKAPGPFEGAPPTMTVKGSWQTTGVISGHITQSVCDGMPRDYTAYNESIE